MREFPAFHGQTVGSEGRGIGGIAVPDGIGVLDVGTGRIESLPAHDGRVVALSASGRWLAWGGGERRVELRDLSERGADRCLTRDADLEALRLAVEATQKPGERFHHARPGPAFIAAVFSPDERWLAGATTDGRICLWELVSCGLAAEVETGSRVQSLAFSPDSSGLAASLADGSLHRIGVWKGPGAPEAKEGEQGMEEVWRRLGGEDAAAALEASRELSSGGDGTARALAERLRTRAPSQAVAWIGLLDSQRLEERQLGGRRLREGMPFVEPEIRSAMGGKPSEEQRQEMSRILAEAERAPCPFPELRRQLRAAAVLERIGTAAAKEALQELAERSPSERVRREAKAALGRMGPVR